MSYRRAGLVFEDPAFHLMVLDATVCTDDGLVPEDFAALLDQAEAQVGSLTERVAALVAHCHTIPIDPGIAADLESLCPERVDGLYDHLELRAREYSQSDDEEADESDAWATPFDVRSLRGVEKLVVLEHLEWTAAEGATIDLEPLTNHPSLVTVSLSGHCKNVRALETCPALRRVFWAGATVDEPAIAERLAGRVHFL